MQNFHPLENRARPMQLNRHPDSSLSYDTLGQVPNSYRPTYQFDGNYIDDAHRFYSSCPTKGIVIDIGVPGWLRREDALKLYECGYFAKGDILELGTNRGLSTSILAESMINAGRPGQIVTIELMAGYLREARVHLERKGVIDRVDMRCGDANAVALELSQEGRRFGFAFVDHSHAYEHMVLACQRLKELMIEGALVVFHDYNDKRNTRRTGLGESNQEYGVFAAVDDALDKNAFEFMGAYGCCGVYRRRA